MTNEKEIKIIIEGIEEYCMHPITAHNTITMLKKQRGEIVQLRNQLANVQYLYLNLKKRHE